MRGLLTTTGIAARSASCPRIAGAFAGKVETMISGRSAAAIHSASCATDARIGVRRRRLRPRLQRADRLRHRRRQWFARQHEIDGPARARHRDFDRARDHVTDLSRHAQLVVPLHQLAHHAGLVEHFLRPVNRARARAEGAFLGDRRAPGGENERDAIARQVGEIVDRVGRADIDVNHHGLRMSGHQIGAMRHADREVFVRDEHGPRDLGIGLFGAAEGFHDRRKVGAGIGEEILDAVIGQCAQECFGGNRWPLSRRCCGHFVSPLVASG